MLHGVLPTGMATGALSVGTGCVVSGTMWGAAGDTQGFVTKAVMLVAACPATRKGGCEGSGCLIASSALSDSPPQTSRGHAVSLFFLQETPRSNFPSRLDDEIERF